MSVYVRPFRVSDLAAFEPMEPLSEPDGPEFVQAIEDSGLAVTGVRNGKIVGSGGIHPVDDFVGEAWLRLSKDCLKHKVDTMRWIRDGMKIVEEAYPFKQLNASIKSCFKIGARMVERLGFTLVQEKTYEGEKWLIYSKRVQE